MSGIDYFHLLVEAATMESSAQPPDCNFSQFPCASASSSAFEEGKSPDYRNKRAGSDDSDIFREDKKVKMDTSVMGNPISAGNQDFPDKSFSFSQGQSEIFRSDGKSDGSVDRNQARREVFRKIANIFNLNDARELLEIIREYTSEETMLTAKFLPVEIVGIVHLLTYWNMILESYPDSMIEINHVKDAFKNGIEYGIKLSGHRITAQPVNTLFAVMTQKLALGGKVTSEDTLKVVTRSSVKVHTSTAACPFIVVKGKIVLTFGPSGKIARWFIDIPV